MMTVTVGSRPRDRDGPAVTVGPPVTWLGLEVHGEHYAAAGKSIMRTHDEARMTLLPTRMVAVVGHRMVHSPRDCVRRGMMAGPHAACESQSRRL
jgi:hypothetical protein